MIRAADSASADLGLASWRVGRLTCWLVDPYSPRAMPMEFLTDAQVAGYGRFDGVPSRADLERFFLPRRVSTADQNPQLQLDALAAEDCLKVHTDRASGTKADRPQWTACLADLRPATPWSSGGSTGSAATCGTSSTSSPPCKPAGSGSGR